MAYYTALITAWNGATQPPTGVTGAGLLGGDTTAQKLAKVNAWTVVGTAQKALLTPSQILNAIVFADLSGLTQLQVTLLTAMLAGSAVDASAATTIRTALQTIFAGKTTTLANLAALVAAYDSPPTAWAHATVAQGGAGLVASVQLSDATQAGLS